MKRFLHLCFVFAVVKAITVPSFGRKNARQVAEHAEAWRATDERRDEIGEVRRLGFVILEQGEAAAIESMHLEKILG